MSIRLSRTILGDRYELSDPITPAGGRPFRVLTDPIMTRTFSCFLNELGHVEKGNGPVLVNIVNYDQSLCYSNGMWRPKTAMERRPITLLTFCAARLLAEWAGMHLMDRNQWEAALALDRPQLRELPSAVLNVEDAAEGPVDVDRMPVGRSGARGMLGNVGFWGEKTVAGFAWYFGVGWNKSRLHLDGPAARQRWIHATSVSTGIRLVEPCESWAA